MLDRDQIAAVLFDLDGTLMDTDDQAVDRLVVQMRRLRLADPHRAARRLIMAAETPGNLLMTTLDVLGLDGVTMAFTDRLRRWRGLHTQLDFRLIEDGAAMLEALHGRYRLAVVTTRGRAEAEVFLNQHRLDAFFDAIVTRESTWRLKPHPAPVLPAARLLDLPVVQCVMVGDTTMDITSARRAGAWAVGVLCGFGERAELERAGAHIILEHTSHLATVL
jgi:phosphoglycolate phosphatase-like HAD superfamily hydrolase